MKEEYENLCETAERAFYYEIASFAIEGTESDIEKSFFSEYLPKKKPDNWPAFVEFGDPEKEGIAILRAIKFSSDNYENSPDLRENMENLIGDSSPSDYDLYVAADPTELFNENGNLLVDYQCFKELENSAQKYLAYHKNMTRKLTPREMATIAEVDPKLAKKSGIRDELIDMNEQFLMQSVIDQSIEY